MIYMGSKRRLAKYLLPIILKDRKYNQYYIEPFAGGFNLIDKVDGLRIANDSNKYIIALFKALQLDWQPPQNISKEEYLFIKDNKEQFPDELVAFVGFCCSYGAKWWAGYAKNKDNDNYAKMARNSLIKQSKNIKDIALYNLDYRQLFYPENSIIYFDPPYENTTKYKGTDKFNYPLFWDFVREKSKNNTCFVSSYKSNIPNDFTIVWEGILHNSLDENKKLNKIEVLIKYL